MSGTVRQITLSTDTNTRYFLRVDWTLDFSSGFTLTLTDGISVWIGEVSEDDMTQEANEMEVPREKYVDDLLQALTKSEEGKRDESKTNEQEKFSFHLSPDQQQLSFSKIYKDISMHLGSVDLKPAPNPVEIIQQMIGQSLECIVHLGNENNKLLEENGRLKQEHQEILTKLEQLVDDKVMLENKLYSRFVLVLNAKKAKIRELETAVHRLHSSKDQRVDEAEEQSGNDTTQGDDARGNKREKTFQRVHPSQAPTLLITGRDLVPHGISLDQTFSDSEEEEPRRKRRLLPTPRTDSP